MYEVFDGYGSIDEVIIPKKLDIRGKRYGFVRFFNVEDDRLFAVKLGNIFIGRIKIFVNLPRFSRKGEQVNKVIPKFNRVQVESKNNTTLISQGHESSNNKGHISYVEVFKSQNCIEAVRTQVLRRHVEF